jgi:hypothetical protein
MDHGNKNISDSLEGVAAQLSAEDGSFRVAVVVRDKQRPYDEPTVIRAMSSQEIKDFVDGIPDQVHYLALTKGESKGFAKISLSAKTGKYNVFAESQSKMSKAFDKDLLMSISSVLAEELREEWSNFLTEEDGEE